MFKSELPPLHPGILFRDDVLPNLGMTKLKILGYLGISRDYFNKILNAKTSMPPEMCLKIGKLCGNGPTLWMNLQSAHDLWRAENSLTLKSALKRIPDIKNNRKRT